MNKKFANLVYIMSNKIRFNTPVALQKEYDDIPQAVMTAPFQSVMNYGKTSLANGPMKVMG